MLNGFIRALLALSAILSVIVVFSFFGGPPSSVKQACLSKAVQVGAGRCSVSKGRQNSSGVWLVKLDCSRGVAMCMDGSNGRININPWDGTSEFIYNSD